jgi:hypothetical protein
VDEKNLPMALSTRQNAMGFPHGVFSKVHPKLLFLSKKPDEEEMLWTR